MKNKLSLWQLFGFIFTGIAGVLLHFAYEWSNQSLIFAPFSAVNESIWEHMKLLFIPMFVFALIENIFFGPVYDSFWCVKLVGILSGTLLIPILYYSYTGIFGVRLDWINIAIFFIANAMAYLLELYLLKNDILPCISPLLALLILCFVTFIFVVFTFVPPSIPLFEPPLE